MKITLLLLLLLGFTTAVEPSKLFIRGHQGFNCKENPEFSNLYQAMNAAVSGDKIIMCCGTHGFSSTVNIGKNGLSIIGKSNCVDTDSGKPRILFEHPCSGIENYAKNIKFNGIEFDKSFYSLNSCPPTSKFAISSHETICSSTYQNMTIKNCLFHGNFHGHISVRGSEVIKIIGNTFEMPKYSSLNISNSNGLLVIKNNKFSNWKHCAVCVVQNKYCNMDSLTGKIKIIKNKVESNGFGDTFLFFKHWTTDNNVDLRVKYNSISNLRKYAFTFFNPMNTDQVFLDDSLVIKGNTIETAMAGIVVEFNAPTNSVPIDGSIRCIENQFCQLSGVAYGEFEEGYGIGYTHNPLIPPPVGASLNMFNSKRNQMCECSEIVDPLTKRRTIECTNSLMSNGCGHECPEDCNRNGICLEGRCRCEEGWKKPCCNETVETEPCGRCHPNCNNHGRCVGGDECRCKDGWGEPCCREPVPSSCCEGHGCGDNGICMCPPTRPCFCKCRSGWTGGCCHIRGSTTCGGQCPLECNGHGACRNNTCSCTPGWGDPCCSDPPPTPGCQHCPANCAGHGACRQGRCSCSPGWDEPCCNQTTQAPPPPECGQCPSGCSGHGQCHNDRCVCEQGWATPCCNETLAEICCKNLQCADNNCGAHGRCNFDGTCQCECRDGWSGGCCRTPPPGCGRCPQHCHGHGHCDVDHCHCDSGWDDTTCCAKPEPPPEFKCFCKPPHHPKVCCGHGECIGPNNCSCIEGWKGKSCCRPPFKCFCKPPHHPKVCCGHGSCNGPNDCQCEEGWFGPKCCSDRPPPPWRCWGKSPDNNDGCSGHGECVGPNECDCDDGWYGKRCRKRVKCFGKGWNNSAVCCGNGQCLGVNDCECDEGWAGKKCCKPEYECYFKHPDHPHVCNGHGVCAGQDDCECRRGWEGPRCNKQCSCKCFGHSHDHPSSCHGHGDCIGHDRCRCKDGWHGKKCDKRPRMCHGRPYHHPHVCSQHGRCTREQHCECHYGYHGDKCQKHCSGGCFHNRTCNGLPPHHPECCSGHGECTHQDQCVCNDIRYTGRWCGRMVPPPFMCYHHFPGSPHCCHGHGQCVGPNICQCHKGWDGHDCKHNHEWTNHTCFGLPPKHKGVCCDHGVCVDQDECECDRGWHGTRCCDDKPPIMCHKYPKRHPDVCCGHGRCIHDEICECREDWKGPNCCHNLEWFDTQCFGIPAFHKDKVCCGHGVCVDDDTCDCDRGWWGDRCCDDSHPITCWDLPAIHPDVCSGHGRCRTDDVCICEDDWTGPACGKPPPRVPRNDTCFGIPWNDPSVCNENGRCIDQDTCRCRRGFFGKECIISMMILECQSNRRVIKLCNNHGFSFEVNSIIEGWEVESEEEISTNSTECVVLTIVKIIPSATDTPTLWMLLKDGQSTVETFIIRLPSCVDGLGGPGTAILIISLVIFIFVCCIAFFIPIAMDRRNKYKMN